MTKAFDGIRADIQRLICDTDPANGGPVAYSADDITPTIAAEWLARGEFADGTLISDEQRAALSALAKAQA